MLIVSDTTPLHYLILLGKQDILPILFAAVTIPHAVFQELNHENTPHEIKKWFSSPPRWLTVQTVSENSLIGIEGLGRGETEAIAIALERNVDALLLDDRRGIREAKKRDLSVLTTLEVLELAAIKGLIDLQESIDALRKTTFFMPTDEVIQEMLKRNHG